MKVFKSRYTPNLVNGRDVHFEIGEVVKAKSNRTGMIADFLITSDYMSNDVCCPGITLYGYEGHLVGNGLMMFISDDQIVDWKGKVKE